MRTILLCDDAAHADVVDQIVHARLVDVDGAVGNHWSEVLTDGTRYGILWAEPVSDLFGVPEDFPELQLVEETADAPWSTYVPPVEEVEP